MRTLCALLFALPAGAGAQSWCAPGAERVYGFGSQQANGVTIAEYTGDMVIQGIPSQRIDQTTHAYQPAPWPGGQV